MTDRTYPSDPAETGLRLFLRWFGSHYARSTAVLESESNGSVLTAQINVGRRWEVDVALLNTLAPDASVAFEASRAAIEKRLDGEGRSIALWAPRGALLPIGEPGLSQLAYAISEAKPLEDGRLEVRRPVSLYLRRTGTTGSVVTVLGGLAASWAQFTNRVPGSFQLNSLELFRLPSNPEERTELAERIVLAAGQPDVDDTQVVRAEDVWTANDLGEGGSCVLGTPVPESDEASSSLRRNLRKLLKGAAPVLQSGAETKALVVLGAATYAEDEKLTWALRGMDPTLYAGYDIIAVIADGVVKLLLQPNRQTLPWDAPLA